MTLTLSIDNVCTLIYARMALDRALYGDEAAADILCPDRKPALKHVVAGAFCELSLGLLTQLEDVRIPEDPTKDDYIEITTTREVPTALRRALEDTLARITLSHVNTDGSRATRFAAIASEGIAECRRMFETMCDPPAATSVVVVHYY